MIDKADERARGIAHKACSPRCDYLHDSEPYHTRRCNRVTQAIHEAMAEENEACAKLVEKLATVDRVKPSSVFLAANAIRARQAKEND